MPFYFQNRGFGKLLRFLTEYGVLLHLVRILTSQHIFLIILEKGEQYHVLLLSMEEVESIRAICIHRVCFGDFLKGRRT